MTKNNEDYNEDELYPPEWLNDDFFLGVLSNWAKSGSALKVLNTKVEPASKKGDHYASVMFRATVDYQLDGVRNCKSMIVKTMPEMDGHKKELIGNSAVFETEIGMYTEVLPRLEQMLRDVGDETTLKAACLYATLSPRKIIVFEDIVPLGFEVIRYRLVNREEAKLVYTKLAKFHATSYKIIKEEPQFLDKYRYGVFEIPHIEEDELMYGGINNFVEFLKATPALHEFVSYFESLSKNLLQQCRTSFGEYRNAPKEDAYYVLNHGDFHIKNLMFKHNRVSGQPEDVTLLDYQLCYVGPMVNDLLYSKYTLLDQALRKDFSALLYHYFVVFTETLKKIGFKGEMPKMAKLRAQIMEHKHFEFFLMSSLLPIFKGYLDPKVDVVKLMTSNEFRKEFYSHKEFLDEMLQSLPEFKYLGYFEE